MPSSSAPPKSAAATSAPKLAASTTTALPKSKSAAASTSTSAVPKPTASSAAAPSVTSGPKSTTALPKSAAASTSTAARSVTTAPKPTASAATQKSVSPAASSAPKPTASSTAAPSVTSAPPLVAPVAVRRPVAPSAISPARAVPGPVRQGSPMTFLTGHVPLGDGLTLDELAFGIPEGRERSPMPLLLHHSPMPVPAWPPQQRQPDGGGGCLTDMVQCPVCPCGGLDIVYVRYPRALPTTASIECGMCGSRFTVQAALRKYQSEHPEVFGGLQQQQQQQQQQQPPPAKRRRVQVGEYRVSDHGACDALRCAAIFPDRRPTTIPDESDRKSPALLLNPVIVPSPAAPAAPPPPVVESSDSDSDDSDAEAEEEEEKPMVKKPTSRRKPAAPRKTKKRKLEEDDGPLATDAESSTVADLSESEWAGILAAYRDLREASGCPLGRLAPMSVLKALVSSGQHPALARFTKKKGLHPTVWQARLNVYKNAMRFVGRKYALKYNNQTLTNLPSYS